MDSEKPFPCRVSTCQKSFTTEDHLAVHRKTHEIMLNLPKSEEFIVDKTPTPSRLIQNMAEIGLFDENIFEVTFRKANEEKQLNPNSSSCSSLRRTISIQNEDTLHTPQIPLHLYKSETPTETIIPDETNLISSESPLKKAKQREESPVKNRKRARGRSKKETNLDTLLPPPNLTTIDTPPIPIAFPDAIQIKPKWTVVLQYPSFETPQTTTSAKERLKTLLVKNESSINQTITLTPRNSEPIQQESPGIIETETAQLALPPLKRVDDPPPPAKVIKTPSALERNNAATKRYRNKKKDFIDNLVARNNQLEEENRKLRMENRMLHNKIQEFVEKGERSGDL